MIYSLCSPGETKHRQQMANALDPAQGNGHIVHILTPETDSPNTAKENTRSATELEQILKSLPIKPEHEGLIQVYLRLPAQGCTAQLRFYQNQNSIQRCGSGTIAAQAALGAFIKEFDDKFSSHAKITQLQTPWEILELGAQDQLLEPQPLLKPQPLAAQPNCENSSVTSPNESPSRGQYPHQEQHQEQHQDRSQYSYTSLSLGLKPLSKDQAKKLKPIFKSVQALRWWQAGGEGDYLIAQFAADKNKEDCIAKLQPDFDYIKATTGAAIIATAPSPYSQFDFILRYFAPQYGNNEDVATGSANIILAPLWASILGKTILKSRQVSQLGGECELTLPPHELAPIRDDDPTRNIAQTYKVDQLKLSGGSKQKPLITAATNTSLADTAFAPDLASVEKNIPPSKVSLSAHTLVLAL